MEERLIFSDEFIRTLDTLKDDTNTALIYSMYVISSNSLGLDRKERFFSAITVLGEEFKSMILQFDLARITKFNIRESEKVFIEKADLTHRHFRKEIEAAERKYGVLVDRVAEFNINEVIERLRERSVYSEHLVSKASIDNLLLIKILIIKIYENQVKRSIEREANMDRQLFEVKEKAFLQGLFNATNRNPAYFYRSMQLLKKFISAEGKKVRIGSGEGAAMGDVWIKKDTGDVLITSYHSTEMGIDLSVAKSSSSGFFTYAIEGVIEKSLAHVDFGITENVRLGTEEAFERLSGIDFLSAQYELALIQERTADDSNLSRNDALNRKIIDKGIDDLLFS